MENTRQRQYLFLCILLAQISFLASFVLSVTSSVSSSSAHLDIALFFRRTIGFEEGSLVLEGLVFIITTLFMRVFIEIYPRILLLLSLLFYTLSGSFIVAHLASLLVCADDDTCLDSDPDTERGRNTIYISAPLLILSFLLVHGMNFYLGLKGAVLQAIARNTMFILFTVSCAICILDDDVWDWKYAYAFLFTLGITTYLNGVSTFILVSKEGEIIQDVWQTAALVFLQPLLFVEESVKLCLTT
jgi:hypothetical protein